MVLETLSRYVRARVCARAPHLGLQWHNGTTAQSSVARRANENTLSRDPLLACDRSTAFSLSLSRLAGRGKKEKENGKINL